MRRPCARTTGPAGGAWPPSGVTVRGVVGVAATGISSSISVSTKNQPGLEEHRRGRQADGDHDPRAAEHPGPPAPPDGPGRGRSGWRRGRWDRTGHGSDVTSRHPVPPGLCAVRMTRPGAASTVRGRAEAGRAAAGRSPRLTSRDNYWRTRNRHRNRDRRGREPRGRARRLVPQARARRRSTAETVVLDAENTPAELRELVGTDEARGVKTVAVAHRHRRPVLHPGRRL